jgi:tRNA A-37 threonylcarbamoyl transferase component Bud32
MDSWQTAERHYTRKDETFVKRELHQDEKIRDLDGKLIEIPLTRERLQNEAEALKLLKKTTIPVPEVARSYYDEEGIYVLETERIFSETLDNIDPDKKNEALANVDKFLREIVLPQLQGLRSCTLGNLVGLVIPADRVTEKDKRRDWQRKTAPSEKYVLCHNDLAQHNIMVDPETLQPVAILDWEYAGYYPPEVEACLWHKPYNEQVIDEKETLALLEFF